MSSIENNELWQAFFTEVSEQLDGLELILADNEAESNADINQLFRDFHTIKSSCAMMDFHSMEKIAHASEDFLDLVRKGRTTLTASTISELLHGIDWLKEQLRQAKTHGTPPKDNQALVDRLRILSVSSATQHPEATDTIDNFNTNNDNQEDRLSTDEIDEFASACRQELPIGLAPDADIKSAKRSLNKLITICNLVGFSAISTLLKKFVKLKSQGHHERSTSTASEIIERIILLEKSYLVDCGSLSLRDIFLDAIFVDFAQLSGRLDYLLDAVESNPNDNDALSSCEELLSKLSINCGLFGYTELLNFFRYVLQTIRSIRRGTISDRRSAFTSIRQALDFPIAEKVQDGESTSFSSELKTRLADLNYGISQAINSHSGEDIKDFIARSTSLGREVIDLLMPESAFELHSAIVAEKKIYEVDVNIDSNEEMAEKIIESLSENSSIIHSRSIFSSGSNNNTDFSNFICFIIAVKNDENSADVFLQEVDPEKIFYICRNVSEKTKSTEKDTYFTEENSEKNISKDSNTDQKQKISSSTLRIEASTLDDLITQAGEMIMSHNMLSHEILGENFYDDFSFLNDFISSDKALIDDESLDKIEIFIDAFLNSYQRISDKSTAMRKSSVAIQNRIMDLRVIPVSSVFNRIPSLVKKMADTQGKLINLVIEGKDVRIDKGMVDILMEPLIHLVRNCIDHGIESPADRISAGKSPNATLTLSAFQEGSTLLLEISDNGRGINLQKIRSSAIDKGFIQSTDVLSEQETCKLIFLPGFSTADVITETSGRGVGMDVVITRINHIGGDIDVRTTPGHGTRFIMALPLSAAIQSVIMLEVDERKFAMPQSSILEIISPSHDSISSILGQRIVILKGSAIPLFRLGTFLNQESTANDIAIDSEHENCIAIIIGNDSQKAGLIVDKVFTRTDVFVRELHRDLRAVQTISGATTLGSGELAFILNSNFLLQKAQQASRVLH